MLERFYNDIDTPVKIILEKTGRDIRIREKGFFKGSKRKKKSNSVRGSIKDFSIKSQVNCKFQFRSIASTMKSAITLTYPLELKYSLDGKLIKKHLANFIRDLKYQVPDLKYAWVLEFQKNGNPHFHLMTNYFNDSTWSIDCSRIADIWFKVVGSGLDKHLHAGTRFEKIRNEKAVGDYMASYLQKQDQKHIPDHFYNVGRFWGASRSLYSPKIEVIDFEDSFEGVNNARAFLRTIKKYRRAKLRDLRLKTGKKYRTKVRAGGFICWEGASTVNRIIEYQNSLGNVPF